jgi:hypothetical protein
MLMPLEIFRTISPDEIDGNDDFSEYTEKVFAVFMRKAGISSDSEECSQIKKQLGIMVGYYKYDSRKLRPSYVKETLRNFTKPGRDNQKMDRLAKDGNAFHLLIEAGASIDDIGGLWVADYTPELVKLVRDHAPKALILADEVWPKQAPNERNKQTSAEREFIKHLAAVWEFATKSEIDIPKLSTETSRSTNAPVHIESGFSKLAIRCLNVLGDTCVSHAALICKMRADGDL